MFIHHANKSRSSYGRDRFHKYMYIVSDYKFMDIMKSSTLSRIFSKVQNNHLIGGSRRTIYIKL